MGFDGIWFSKRFLFQSNYFQEQLFSQPRFTQSFWSVWIDVLVILEVYIFLSWLLRISLSHAIKFDMFCMWQDTFGGNHVMNTILFVGVVWENFSFRYLLFFNWTVSDCQECQDTWAGQGFSIHENTWTLVILQTAVNCFHLKVCTVHLDFVQQCWAWYLININQELWFFS